MSAPSPNTSSSSGEHDPKPRKTPFVAYTAAAAITIYVLAWPTSMHAWFITTVIALLIMAIGYTCWIASQ